MQVGIPSVERVPKVESPTRLVPVRAVRVSAFPFDSKVQSIAAASFIALVPVITVFVLLQRYFVAGLTAGAVKG